MRREAYTRDTTICMPFINSSTAVVMIQLVCGGFGITVEGTRSLSIRVHI